MATSSTEKRIHTPTSRTAEWTCMFRAASALESNPWLHSDDYLAPKIIPSKVLALLRTGLGRLILRRCLAAKGIYEYVIARTKYIDAAFQQALAAGIDQIVLFGAGFDARAQRFQAALDGDQVFELDVPITQSAKIDRFRQCGLVIPLNLHFIAIDFDRDSIPDRLAQAGFQSGRTCLFILEGVLMYLEPASVENTFRTFSALGAKGSRVFFDYVRASVLRGENTAYGEKGATHAVAKVNENWRFGLESGQVESFLSTYGFRPIDHKDAAGLERLYFADPPGAIIARISGTHGIVTAERS